MKVIIAGSRSVWQYAPVKQAIEEALSEGWDITEVVCGCAAGPDSAGAYWARQNGVPVKEFPADWDTYGRKAGMIRNGQMADYGDGLIAVWDSTSPGTGDMIYQAQLRGLRVKVVRV